MDFSSDISCNALSSTDDVHLRRPTKEEIATITTHMVAQVQTRNMAARNEDGRSPGMFIKGSDSKNSNTNKNSTGSDQKNKCMSKALD